MIALLEEQAAALAGAASAQEAFAQVKKDFDGRVKALKKQADTVGKRLSHVFRFCEEVFAEGQEMLILVTELTVSPFGARFISLFGCEAYFAHNRDLLFYERRKEIAGQLDALDLSAL